MSDPEPTDGPGADSSERADADDAFAALGNETRLRVLRALAAADEPPTFTELFEATDEETSAGFAYHLRQLTDGYVRKDPDTERYRLTYAGRQAARALAAGTYTERVTREPEPVEGDCPVCGDPGLEVRVADNFLAVACTDCGTELLSLPFPPNGARDRDAAEVLAAFDAHHRSRFRLLADGVCPDCAGRAGAEIEVVDASGLPGGARRPVLSGSCVDCDFGVRAPVSFAAFEHPEVVAFFREHGESVRDRPLWNLGPEWSEAVLSEEPAAVRVSVELDGERLDLLVGDGPTVVEVRRAGDADAGDDGGTRPDGAGEHDAGNDADDYDATAAGSS
ncbi:winged helix-turn-helix domain-containing protein [Halorarum salinum]|uniref:Winged helix-turn-helix transcriptional regulator n=1 Tax=Halorarum salinum TaxID=2743089 RepID=A0A7D5QAH6_9EURY|nr:winged helix-turn-helix domain-containing protein [Halobaculum salinum]QLG62417.1 winged helix-turn-helix transcriptional regulator [Halobaculum salinum]